MREIDEIVIVFENTDCMRIPAKYIKTLILDNIKETVSKTAVNYIASYKTCNDVLIHILKDAEKCTFKGLGDDILHLNRLTDFNDITQIELCCKGVPFDSVFPQWNGRNDFSNDNQKSVNIDGDIVIGISCNTNSNFDTYVRE